MTEKKIRSIRKMIAQFQAIQFHSRKESSGDYTILLKDIILVGHIPEETLRDYITNEINTCLKRVAGRMEDYLVKIDAKAKQVDLDFFGEAGKPVFDVGFLEPVPTIRLIENYDTKSARPYNLIKPVKKFDLMKKFFPTLFAFNLKEWAKRNKK